MSKRVLIILFLMQSGLQIFAGDGEYAVSKIPAALLKNAHAVKRFGEVRYEVISYTKVFFHEKYAITILDENGDGFAFLHKYYDKLRSIKSIDGKLYDADGKELKSLKNKDIMDISAVSSMSLMEDSRVKAHNFYYKVYPYTVEYEVVTEFNNTYIFPGWIPQPAEEYAVEKETMIVKCPSWFIFHYKMFNYQNGGPVVRDENDNKIYTWQVANMQPIVKEYAEPDWQYITTCIYFSPEQFEIGKYKGTMASWKDLGQFQLQLNEGRDKLPDAIKQKVHSLTDGVSDTREKVRILYEYMQKNTRYVSVQLGIGGLQPFDASYVASKSYGDCKALSNYMYAILKEANIKSCYTQIKAGKGEYFFIPDFPADQFDHIILCVPLSKDTMWLECTSQTLPAGYLGEFTCNRYALSINEDGGSLVHTPKYGMKENIQNRHITASLDEEATLHVKAFTSYGGLQQDLYHDLINGLSKDKLKEFLHEYLDFATYDINNFDYKETSSSMPVVEELLDIAVSNYATITGKRLFIIPNVMTRTLRKLTAYEERKYDLEFGFEYKDVDSVEINLPAGYTPESMPQDVSVSSKFGKYNCSVKFSGNKLFYYRNIERYSGRFPAGDYAELVKFYETICKTDRNKVVLVKNQ
jgi:Domain of Unknown Function with PDB structure (DUF3857)